MRRLICCTALLAAMFWAGCAHAPKDTGNGTISVTVLDEHGANIQSSRVGVAGIRGGAMIHPDGSFLIEKIPLGAQTVFVEAQGFTSDSQQVVITRGCYRMVRFILSEAGLVTARGSISGMIADSQGIGVYLALAKLKESPRAAMTDQHGHFSIESVPVGTYTLTASLVGFAKATKDSVQVYEGQRTTVNLKLKEQPVKVRAVH